MSLQLEVTLPLDRFELKVDVELKAQVTALFGPSGAGKTSLLESIAGLRRGALGTITFNGTGWLDSARGVYLPPEQRRIGYVPQDGLLFPHLNTRENLLSGAQRQSAEQSQARLEQVSRVLQLEPLWGRQPSTLSGGERQRVALGRALCSAPELLLLDEPLGALDIGLKRRLLPFLRQVREEFAVPMLLVSHSPGEVLALCDEVLAFDAGRVVARGRPEDVLMGRGRLDGHPGEGGSTLALLRGTDELESTLPCEIVHSAEDRCVVELAQGVELFCRALREPLQPAARKHALVSVAARDVILARTQPERISARNVLVGKVRQVDAGGVLEVALLRQVEQQQQVGEQAPHPDDLQGDQSQNAPGLLVELSHSAIRELGLEAGLSVYVVIKSSACVVSPAQG